MEKLSPKESVEGAHTVLRGSVRAPEGFSEGKPEAAKQRGRSPRGFAAEAFNLLPREYIEYSRKLPGAPFTMIPPRLSNRFSFFLTNARGAALGSSEFAARRKHEIVFLCRGALDKNRFVMPREYRGEYTRQKAETLTQLNRNILVRW